MMIMMVAIIIMMVILMIMMTKMTKKTYKYKEFWVKFTNFRDYYMVRKGPKIRAKPPPP